MPISMVDGTETLSKRRDEDNGRDSESLLRRIESSNSARSSLSDISTNRKGGHRQERRYVSSLSDNVSELSTDGSRPFQSVHIHDCQQGDDVTNHSNSVTETRADERFRSQPAATDDNPHTQTGHPLHEIDVLWENQRGWFFFGVPLYSHSSLLNFDPGPWVTRDRKNSPVDITNAQLPNPSWRWVWKSWYVDMSHDVDEEGWQYSFSFSRKFSWHGTHPWFHSFVRRRRWFRKRAMKNAKVAVGASNLGMSDALQGDYFTIHSRQHRSPASGSQYTTKEKKGPASQAVSKQVDLPLGDIRDIPTLMIVLKHAVIDRAKVDAVQRFVEVGGEELVYLKEYISTILQFLVFQASRMYLLEYLSRTATYLRDTHRSSSSEARYAQYLAEAVQTSLEKRDDSGHKLPTMELAQVLNKNNSERGSAYGDPNSYNKSPSIVHDVEQARRKQDKSAIAAPLAHTAGTDNSGIIHSIGPISVASSSPGKQSDQRYGDGDSPVVLPSDSAHVDGAKKPKTEAM